ncbi:rho-related protein racA-like [Mizuhopecten yessoensis]|nr:rho-related protein racA-like [Mizuhopecten yessoensis]
MKDLYFNKPETADVVFKVGGKIYCHKCVLSARCKLMAAMFGNRFEKDEAITSEVDIPATSAECFQALLEYLYSDHAPTDETDGFELICLADEYGQHRLMNLCELNVTKEINRSVATNIGKAEIDVIGHLQKAQKYNAEQLSSWCFHFISTNYTAFQNRVEFSCLTEGNKIYIEENQWPPISYLREVEEYKNKLKQKKRQMFI